MNFKKVWILIIILFAILNIGLIIFWRPLTDAGKRILNKNDIWSAVHLSNGIVYFGRIESLKPDRVVLADAHYLEALNWKEQDVSADQNFRTESLPKQTYNLTKQGSDKITSTDGVIFINRSSVLFWEKLNNDSEVVKWLQKSTGK